MSTLQPLVDAHAVLAMEQQLHLSDVVEERPFDVNLDAGTITFGGDLSYRAELVGSEAPGPGTWLWAWANPSGFPDHVTAAARAVRAYGEEHGIAAPAFYSAPLDGGGRVYLLVDDPSLALPAPEVPRVITTLSLVHDGGWVQDWPTALERYASQRGVTHARDGDTIRLEGPELGGHVQVALDDLGRVAELSGSAGPQDAAGDAPPPKRGLLARLRRS